MKELIFAFVQQYAAWGILIALALTILILAGMQHQLRKLNRSLGMVTQKIQAYFEVIMEEEEAEEAPGIQRRGLREEDRYLTREERECLLSTKHEATPGDEKVFNEVLQEYFS